MEATLNALAQILLQAIPTFFLVLLLHQYLKAVFFKPLARVLAERSEATEGARKKAAESLERAAAKAAAYEESLRAARNEIYREHEEVRRKWLSEQSAQVLQARTKADAAVKEAKAKLAGEAETAKADLEASSRLLADQITRTILQRRVAA
jgi:F-type H+-transporting ATPase subunit b